MILSRPQSEPVFGTNCRRLLAPFLYRDERTGKYILIPAGFIWDGTSIPRILWSAMGGPFSPMYEIAGLVHDFLYRKFTPVDIEKILNDYLRRLIPDDVDQTDIRTSILTNALPRKLSDQIFRDILKLELVHWFRSLDMYYGVRAGGWISYQKKPIDWTPS